ncbi:MAG: hypothetical protein GWO07_01780 [Candidatus Dadabacteria bacterium]|nr:hypothetical protein [Candidatus Dadabacteria bacterium]NIU01683.1 hypothetical protein [Nitrosopumilaceae archaeon]NIX62285.1 hypothetical protein [Nitrosopumilaceae archaeon]
MSKKNDKNSKDSLGRFVNFPGPGRSPGVSNKLTQEIRAIIDENKDDYVAKLFIASQKELELRIKRLNSMMKSKKDQDLRLPAMSATKLCNALVLKCMPALKSLDVKHNSHARFLNAIINLSGEDALNYVKGGVEAVPHLANLKKEDF